MKNILFLFVICFISCQKKTNVIDGNTLLKNVPSKVFIPNNTSKININDTIINFKNTFKRLPNTEFSKFYLKEHSKTYMPYFNLTLNLSINGKITLDGTPNSRKYLYKDITEFIDFASGGKTTMLHLNFDENVTVTQFYSFLQFIKPIKTAKIKINNNLFIYNTKNLPDCDCSL